MKTIFLFLVIALFTNTLEAKEIPQYLIRTKIGERLTLFRIHQSKNKKFEIEYGQFGGKVQYREIDRDDYKFFTEKLSGIVEKRSPLTSCPKSWLSFEAKSGKQTEHFSLVYFSENNATRKRIEDMANFLARYVRL
jgi:hypothetical protein